MCTLAACVPWLVGSAVAEKPTVTPEPAAALTGTVTDMAGKPIVGALVLARSTRHADDPPLSARTTTPAGSASRLCPPGLWTSASRWPASHPRS